MNLIEMIQEFGDIVEGPTDYTDRYWTRAAWGVRWTEEGSGQDDDFEYYSEVQHEYSTNRYMICTLNYMGDYYQAVFDLTKEVMDV